MSATDTQNRHIGSSADNFFAEEDLLEDIEAIAVARLLGAETDADLDFLVGKSGTPVMRESHQASRRPVASQLSL